MKHARKTALAASVFTCAALFSFSWTEQGGISLSIESAQARVGRPLTPVSVAGVARRQNRRAASATATAMVRASQAPQRSARLPQSPPPLLTRDGAPGPTTEVVLIMAVPSAELTTPEPPMVDRGAV